MTTHEIHAEPQPIADQWKLSCSCGWVRTQSLYYYTGPGGQLAASAERHRLIAEHMQQASRDAGGIGPIDVSKHLCETDGHFAYFEMTEALPEECVVTISRSFRDGTVEIARGETKPIEWRLMRDDFRIRYYVDLLPNMRRK